MPYITISRMYGSGGSEVAEHVASALGWSLFDNSMIDRIAARSGLSRDEVSDQEERVPSIVERLAIALSMAPPDLIASLPTGPIQTTEERIIAVTRRIIEEAVQAGPAVFVGRGAQSLLATRQDAMHVLCFAPKTDLRHYEMRKCGVDEAEAERRVSDINKQREQYVKRHWDRQWLALENYHLCLNTGWLGIAGTADQVLDAARRRFATPAG